MNHPTVAPYGTWRSPITADLVVAGARRLEQIMLDGDDLYWLEGRPAERGRVVLVRRRPDGDTVDVTPPPFNVRTRVHEYGGGACTVHEGTVYFVNFADQDIYRLTPGGEPEPLTRTENRRYADLVVDARRRRLLCVREEHRPDAVVNTLVAVNLEDGREQVLVEGSDFYASPRLSPDGGRLAWLSWNHPNMPWDGTELWVAELDDGGGLREPRRVAGGPAESIFQPEWSPDGVLYYVSDRTGWWNLYRWRDGQHEHLIAMEAEFGLPQWRFGMSTYAFASAHDLFCLYTRDGMWYLAHLDLRTLRLEPVETPFTTMSGLRAGGGRVAFLGTSAVHPLAVVAYDVASRSFQILRRAADLEVDPGYLSEPKPISFPTEDGTTAYALFYPPANRDYVAPEGERPPVIVISHGGPTGAAHAAFNLNIQYWTSRGFAVVDVNYGGSTGYGRAYRERLKGRWGLVDVTDCIHAVRHLAAAGLVDGERALIRGGSAGGYTTLAALTFHDAFRAGASYFGVSDLEALARETHKFESRYLDSLIGPYPAAWEVYVARSPIHHVERLSCPVIFFQGLQDRVVPPNQAERMVEALRAKGIPMAYVTFENEDHGFRDAANIKRALEAELYFYSRVLGFEPADELEPVPIENLDP